MSAVAVTVPAAAVAWVETEPTVTSPPNRVIATELVSASALADAPGWVATLPDAEPIRTIEPSSGYEKPVTAVAAPGGPTTSAPATGGWPARGL